MKQTSDFTKETWVSGDYTGDQRPAVRATIHRWHSDREPYELWDSDSATWRHQGHLASSIFNTRGRIRELFNIKSIKYSRAVDTDVATCTIQLYNVQWFADLPNERLEEFDYPGWFTPTRGDGGDNWDYGSNTWHKWLQPDRMIRTFEGYGIDIDQVPEEDEHMYPSGVWLIDDVDFSTDGIITLNCRDLGRLLLDHVMFPPVVPFNAYPLYWEKFDTQPNPFDWATDDGWESPSYASDSNALVETAGLMDGPVVAVASDGKVRGHEGADAVDGDGSTHWLSAGSADPNQLEWIQFDVAGTEFGNDQIEGIRVNPKGGPYTVYVSLYHQVKGWRGAAKIPYVVADDGTDLNADIRFVKKVKLDPSGDPQIIKLPRIYKDIRKIRLTFAPRWDSKIGTRRYRTAIQEVKFTNELHKVTPGTGTVTIGNYDDYTDIIKWLCGWGGFFWPPDATVLRVDQAEHPLEYASPDATLPIGRIWGDFMGTGTAGIVKLDVEMFDKKPVMDGIASIRDIVGFEFWIDETGGAVWRLPNMWKKGNYIMPAEGGNSRPRSTANMVTIDERTTLIDLSAKISSKNVREIIFVANVNGNFGVAVKGFVPSRSNLRRVGGWTDQQFKGRSEARRIADLIAVRQAMSYRTDTMTIAANPAIQIDDQVLIKERMTGEYYLHRVLSISSDFDYEQGKWTYQLSTQWLGNEAFTENAWKPKLSDGTQLFINTLDQR